MPPLLAGPDLQPGLSLQEQALATAMIQRTGAATVNFALQENGVRMHQNEPVTEPGFHQLVEQFERDPKASLAWARESLFAISADDRLAPEKREARLSRYLDAYFSLTLKLDHAAFPPTGPGEVRSGIPDYIPDGLVDMGGERNLDPARRSREMIVADKHEAFTRHKATLMKIFSDPNNAGASTKAKQGMIDAIGKAVYRDMPYDNAKNSANRGAYARLSSYESGVCRHQALAFQVLAQAVGLTSRIVKSHVTFSEGGGGRHSSNAVRINHDWYLFDATNPDYQQLTDGRKAWRPGMLVTAGPPNAGTTVEGSLKYSGKQRTYRLHDDMYWHVLGRA